MKKQFVISYVIIGSLSKDEWEELCEKVVEMRRVSDRVMIVDVVFEENVLRLICG